MYPLVSRVGLLALALLAPIIAWTQQAATSAVTLSVTDPAGTPIADARVTVGIRSQLTGLITDEHGHLNLDLPPGVYGISVSKPGYDRVILNNFFDVDLASTGERARAGRKVTIVLQLEDCNLPASPDLKDFFVVETAVPGELETVRDVDEYAVWNAVLTKYASGNVKALVLRDRTATQNLTIVRLPDFEGAASEAVSNLKAKNQAQYIVENKFSVNVACTLFPRETENGLFQYPADNRLDRPALKRIQDGWSRFHQDHPGAQGLISISRVGFNSDKTVAVVYIGIQASVMRANGTCFLLAKKNGSWVIEHQDVIWFS
jgi:hypothetical protein